MALAHQFSICCLICPDFNHGLDGNDPTCQKHVTDYFTLGYIDFVDGTVCGTDFGDESLLVAAFPDLEG